MYIRACCLEFLAFPLFDSPVKPEPTESKMDRFVAVIDGVEYEYVCELDIGTPDGEPARMGNQQQQLGPPLGELFPRRALVTAFGVTFAFANLVIG